MTGADSQGRHHGYQRRPKDLPVGPDHGPAGHQPSGTGATRLVTALLGGGYVIVMRHRPPTRTRPTPTRSTSKVAKQRHLNDAGRAKAREIGAAMKKLGIPVGEVESSQYFRAIETARLLGFGEPQPTADVSEGGQVVTPIENNRRTAALRKLAATAMFLRHQCPWW